MLLFGDPSKNRALKEGGTPTHPPTPQNQTSQCQVATATGATAAAATAAAAAAAAARVRFYCATHYSIVRESVQKSPPSKQQSRDIKPKNKVCPQLLGTLGATFGPGRKPASRVPLKTNFGMLANVHTTYFQYVVHMKFHICGPRPPMFLGLACSHTHTHMVLV